MTVLGVILGVAVLIILWFVGAYNKLVRLRNNCDNAWAQIDVQLKRRYDLIPNIVNTVKKYLQHEDEVFERVAKARQQAIQVNAENAGDLRKVFEAENFLSQTLRSLFAVTEAYPELKAVQPIESLRQELVNTENKLAFARQHYNDSVTLYNTAIQSIPTNIVAGIGGFTPKELWEIEDPIERENVKVQF